MPVITIPGLSEATGDIFPIIPAGRYECRITKVESTISKEKKLPMWIVAAKVAEGEYNGHALRTVLMLPHENMDAEGLRRVKENTQRWKIALGLDTSTNEIDSDDMLGEHFIAVVNVSKYEGKDQNKISDFLPIGDGTVVESGEM